MQRSLTEARSSALCFFGRERHVEVTVGRALTAHVTKVHRCGSPWACPLCAPVVRQHRALEIDAAIGRHLAAGGGAEFVTLTLRHHRGDSLSSRLDPISQSLRLTLNGAPWKRRARALGYIGAIKAVEITYSDRNGFHPHSHSLLLFDRPMSDDERIDFGTWLFGRWQTVALERGLGSITLTHGVDVRAVSTAGALGEYLTVIDSNWSPGLELTRTDVKRKSPFELLQLLMLTGDKRFAALWKEYERATFGKRAVMWSRGLRELLTGTDKEATDVELASSEGLDLALLRALVPVKIWDSTVRDGTTGRLLSEIEQVAAALLFIADSLGQDVPLLDLPKKERSW